MFDLDSELRKYLTALQSRRFTSRDCVDEIEGHLRDEIEFLIRSGARMIRL